jgi:hypothetical protein
MSTLNTEVILTITEDHFARAVPGDPCHCTIGEATHDALAQIITNLSLRDVDPSTIAVHPANVGGEPCVGVGFVGTDKGGREVTVQFLLEEAAAFKVAYTTDNRATRGMKRTASRHPYVLRASRLKVRKRSASLRPDVLSNPSVTPEGYVKGQANSNAQAHDALEDAQTAILLQLEKKSKEGSLGFRLTPALKKFAVERTAASFERKGTRPRVTQAPVKVYKNRRFHA